MIISHNIAAMNVIRMNEISNKKMQNNMQKISSGYRINKSADDAAGLSISEKMRAQIRGIARELKNEQDTISLIETTDGALSEVNSILQRGRELAVQAANSTNTLGDRELIQKEIEGIKESINSIAADTMYNKHNLFDSNGKNVFAKSITYNIQDFSNVINASSAKGYTQDGLEKFANYIGNVLMPDILGNISAALPISSSKPTIADMKLGLEFYNADDGKLAAVSCNGLDYSLKINLAAYSETNGDVNFNKESLTMVLAHEMMHAVMFDTVTNGMFGMYKGSAFPDWFVEGTAQAIGGAQVWLGGMPNGNNRDELEKWLHSMGTPYAQGYVATMYLGYVAGGGGAVDSKVIASGLDKILADVSSGYSLGESIYRNTNGKYISFSYFENNFAKDAVDFAIELKQIVDNGGSGSIALVGGLSASIETILGDNIEGDYFTLNTNATSHRNDIYAAGKDPFTGGETNATNGSGRDGIINTNASTVWTGAGLTPNNGAAGITNINKINLPKYNVSAKGLGINDLSVLSHKTANEAISSFDSAIVDVLSMRSYYGALQNRMEHRIANLQNVEENIQNSESRIRDADVAMEIVEHSKNSILQQVSQSLLKQAIDNPNNIIKLLQ